MTTAQILEIAGYPTDFVIIDFETYFSKEYSLSKMNTWAYITDERFETIGCGFRFSNDAFQDSIFIWGRVVKQKLDQIQNLYGLCFENITVVMQNAQFDALILQKKYGVSPKHIIDIKHLDSHFDSRRPHRLKDMAKRHKLQDKGDTSQFLGVHLADMTDEQRAAMEEYCKNDVELEYALFEILLPYLSNQEIELAIARHTLDLYLKPKLKFDFKLADELAADMTEYIAKTCEKVSWVLQHEK